MSGGRIVYGVQYPYRIKLSISLVEWAHRLWYLPSDNKRLRCEYVERDESLVKCE